MSQRLAKHATEAGYKAEKANGRICDKCRNAHRIYNKQFTQWGKKNGLKFTIYDVLLTDPPGAPTRAVRSNPPIQPSPTPASPPEFPGESPETPSLSQRLGAVLGSVRTPESGPDEYVSQSDIPEYIHEIDPDPAPSGSEDWEEIDASDFVVNPAGMKKIQENLGFYVTTVGMTLEIIDPYCGSIAAANANNVIEHWSKVIAHYPKAANWFMSEKSGALFAWINALQATWPILYALFEHHFARTIQVQNGVVYRVGKDQPMPHPTQPPMPDSYDYSAR